VGEASLTVTDTYYDGGYTSAGIFDLCCGTHWRIEALGDQPNAVWKTRFERTDWVDQAAWHAAGALNVYSAVSDQQLVLNANLIDSSIVDTMGLNSGSTSASLAMVQGAAVVEGCRLARNGNFNPTAPLDRGGLKVQGSSSVHVPSYEFVSTEWVANNATHGPAVAVSAGSRFDLRFRQCLFR